MKDNTRARWTVDSFDHNRRNTGTQYTVSVSMQDHFHCTCEAFRFGEGQYCKHIEYVQTHPEFLPDQERMSGDELAKILNRALAGKRTVTVHISGGTITLSDR